MEILGLSIDMLKSFLLVLLRVSVILFMMPIFGAKRIPNPIKAGIAFAISLAILPAVTPDPAIFPQTAWEFAFIVLCEIIVGTILGMIVNVFFMGIQMAGHMAGLQMGFAIATIFDPNSGVQSSMVSQLGYWVALIVFLVLDGHYLLILSIKNSFDIIQFGQLSLQKELYNPVLTLASQLFVLAVKVGAPTIAALMFVDVGFGLTAKVSPQMNILIVALPLKIAVGLTFFGISLQLVLVYMKDYLNQFLPMMNNLMRLMI
ncbi:MAG: Flagellar biosynthetic protein fliR [Candidatus Magnetoglobus multicellularis str. Araruama]|uniref:Flagellar biosynthetic protein FliR n=1 Tax=Candidatus Magnetoglobus multicellularis str. Araruama TaxID=890399 RepID=A0A1V1PEB6_9BACT|nr:MAG: Flagellar biosynthetic protein fliR [Candidatus Magnetoglobus multicellularis str. Araruama]